MGLHRAGGDEQPFAATAAGVGDGVVAGQRPSFAVDSVEAHLTEGVSHPGDIGVALSETQPETRRVA